MANKKTVSDEQIIAALLAGGTIRAAAAAVGMSERAVYNRMNNGDFQARYRAAKNDLIRAAVVNLNERLQAAIDTVSSIMQNPENNAAVRLQAAQTILNTAGKYAQRLQQGEMDVANQIDANSWLSF